MILVIIFVLLAKMAASMNKKVHENFSTMDPKEFVEYFNSQNFSFTITDYNRTFHHRSLERPFVDEGLPRVCNVNLKKLPKKFDAREKWPQCETIQEIYDQGDCGSCWAFATANSASDRTCIHKNIHVHLAEQDFKCFEDDLCDGAYPEEAFSFWQQKGLVSNKCKPYDIKKLQKITCEKKCVDENISYKEDKHYAEKVYGLEENIDCIKTELVQNGPIETDFMVYEDFKKYHRGIYEHIFGHPIGWHSVRVIGYGVEKGKEYWLVANSWGEEFGDKGYFKIKMRHYDVQFENNMFAGIPKN